MNAKKCDRCGNFFELPKTSKDCPIRRIAATDEEFFDVLSKHRYLDICPECADSFERWVKNETAQT